MQYVVIIEGSEREGYSAYCPELDGCGATGATVEEVKQLMAEAMNWHIEGMIQANADLPEANAVETYLQPIKLPAPTA